MCVNIADLNYHTGNIIKVGRNSKYKYHRYEMNLKYYN